MTHVLDIGAYDGFFSFGFERRGTEVHSVDIWNDVQWEKFQFAIEKKQSKIKHQRIDVHDLSADIYAWGVTAYELLTHCKPFAGRNPDESLRNQLNGEFHVKPVHLQNSGVPVALTRLIHKCFAYLPENRFPNMTILNAQLHKVLGVQLHPNTPTL